MMIVLFRLTSVVDWEDMILEKNRRNVNILFNPFSLNHIIFIFVQLCIRHVPLLTAEQKAHTCKGKG